MKHRALIVLLILAVAVQWGFVGLVLGVVPASAEPGGEFVDCGPSVFGRPAQLPHPACAGAYAPFDTISIVALTISVLAVLVALIVLVRTRTRKVGPVHSTVNAEP